ncbi:hypothetical protein AtubIFM61612_002565 [Aspergillus tubingensis]|nr:hypothetical protein AtubIFM61612_002565 [Aspergillus tubingensis]
MATKTSQAAKESRIWQDRLRRGRTAWTSKVTVQHRVPGVPWVIPGRYFFDGDNNAREDAAEVAWRKLTNTP